MRSMTRFAASLLACLLLLGCQANLPVGAVLKYEIDRSSLDPGKKIDYRALVDVVERRVNRPKRRGTVELVDGQVIQISIFGSDPQVITQVKRTLQVLGTLEFRIVANETDDADLIVRAKQLSPDETKLTEKRGHQVARWVRVEAKSETMGYFRSMTELGQREVEGDQLDVLVKIDRFNVTGDYLTTASPSESNGQPIVEFAFNAKGASLFGSLTGANLPTPGGHARAMAIILDGKLTSAPLIRSTITDRGVITGNFTVPEVHDLTAILRAGRLPAPLKLVSERLIETRN